jgi:hypothetical protein
MQMKDLTNYVISFLTGGRQYYTVISLAFNIIFIILVILLSRLCYKTYEELKNVNSNIDHFQAEVAQKFEYLNQEIIFLKSENTLLMKKLGLIKTPLYEKISETISNTSAFSEQYKFYIIQVALIVIFIFLLTYFVYILSTIVYPWFYKLLLGKLVLITDLLNKRIIDCFELTNDKELILKDQFGIDFSVLLSYDYKVLQIFIKVGDMTQYVSIDQYLTTMGNETQFLIDIINGISHLAKHNTINNVKNAVTYNGDKVLDPSMIKVFNSTLELLVLKNPDQLQLEKIIKYMQYALHILGS